MSDLDDILYQLGVYPTQRGYHITAVAVAIGRQEPEKLQMLTKWLYPAVALRCSCSSAAVERNLQAPVRAEERSVRRKPAWVCCKMGFLQQTPF